MKYSKYFFLPVLVFVLVGQGCLSSSSQNDEGGVFWTEDGGSSWTQSAILPTVQGVSTIAGTNVLALAVDPSDHDVWYAGTESNGLFYTLDNGASWTRPKADEAREGTVLDIEVDPNDVCTVYLLQPNRVIKTTDCHRTYEILTVEGRADEQFTTFVMDWFNPSILWAGNTAGDILKSADGGVSWSTMHRIRDDIMDITVSNADSRIVLVATEDHAFLRSPDAGVTWVEYEDTFGREYRFGENTYGFAQSRDGSRLLVNTQYGLHTSSDRGETWEPLELRHAPGEVRIWGVTVHPSNPDVISYGAEGAIFISTDGGVSWTSESLPSSRTPRVMMVHPSNTAKLIVGFATED